MSPPPSPPGRQRGWHRGLAAVLLVAPLLAALFLRPSAHTGRWVGLAMLAEPVIIGLTAYLLLVLLSRRWWLPAMSTMIGTATAIALLHAPRPAPPPPDLSIPWADQASACAQQTTLPSAPLRVLSWDASDAPLDEATLNELVALRPDLAIVSGLPDGLFLERMAELLPGESLSFGAKGDQVGLFVRGTFEDCGEQAGAWPLTVFGPGMGPILADYALDHDDQEQLPPHHAARRTSGQLVFAYPRIQGAGTVPVVAYQLPARSSRLGSATWTAGVYEGAQAVAAVATLGGPSAVVAGHLAIPPTFQHVLAVLEGAGLHDAGGPPTWPASIAGWPALPLFRMERILTGSAWQARSAEVVDLPGPHRPLLVQLEHLPRLEPIPFDRVD